MGVLLRDALQRLCAEIGWTYAVFWRAIGFRSPTHLVWEDGHCRPPLGCSGFDSMDLRLKGKTLLAPRCLGNGGGRHVEVERVEDRIGSLVRKMMVNQVHVIGDGIVGKSAFTGNHQWIVLGDALDCFQSKGLPEISIQFSAGVKTIAIIPVLPHGVMQLGSTEMVIENVDFINHVRRLFSELGYAPGDLLSDLSCETSCKRDSPLLQVPNQLLGGYCPTSVASVGDVSSGLDYQLHGSQLLGSSVSQLSCLPFVTLSDELSRGTSVLPSAKSGFGSTVMVQSEPFQAIPSMVNSVHPNSRSSCGQPSAIASFGPFSGTSSVQELVPTMSSTDSHGNNPSLSCFQSHKLMQDELFSGRLGSFNTTLSNRKESLIMASASGVVCSMPNINSSYSNSCSIKPQNKLKASKCTEDSRAIFSEGPASMYHHTNKLPQDKETESHSNQRRVLSKDKDVHSVGFGGSRTLLDTLPCSKISLFDVESSPLLAAFPGNDPSADECITLNYGENLARNKNASTSETGAGVSNCISNIDGDPFLDLLNCGDSYDDIFAEDNHDQLLDAIFSKVKSSVNQMPEYVSCKTSVMKTSSSPLRSSCSAPGVLGSSVQPESKSLLSVLIKNETPISNSVKTFVSGDQTEDCSMKYRGYESHQMFPWVSNDQNMKHDASPAMQCKQVDDMGRMNRKRSRPGESPRPRPKDRQMIQDRVKELREIVPNGAKCSIDALLEKTIKHMLFLQSVTKYADKLKGTCEPKIISKDGGLVLKDNFEGGATWAFEVGSQSLICPIIVEDLNLPRQLLVEMLCEQRGFFLEIADLIRGLGLTILKGVMEARGDKVWAQFAVEANRDVTRMEIFLSLVRLLEPAMGKSYVVPMGTDNAAAPLQSAPTTVATDHLD